MLNEGASILSSLHAIADQARRASADFEIVAVDDGSSDDTWQLVRAESGRAGHLHGVRLSRNFGKEAAVFAGLAHARGRAVIIMDADLQHPPELLSAFIEAWRSGSADVIDGVKRGASDGTLRRRISSGLFNQLITALTGYDFRGTSDYKLIDRKVVNALLQIDETRTFFRGLVEWTGFRHQAIVYDVAPRRVAESRWSTMSLIRLAGRAIVSYSAVPLRVIHLAGVCFLALALVLAGRTLWLYWAGTAPSGVTTIIFLLLVIGAFVLLALAVISEYIAAIYEEVKGRPRYVVTETCGAQSSPD